MSEPLTMETEARRFEQIRSLERALVEKEKEITKVQEELKERRKEWDGIPTAMRQAARNEGSLPLFTEDPS
jgi:hypothetical protein